MATGTTYFPNAFPLDLSKCQGNAQGVSAVCPPNSSTNVDLDLADDHILTFIEMLVSGATFGDYLTLNVVLTANPALVLATPIPGPWYLPNTMVAQDFHLEGPIKVVGGLRLRITVHTTSILTGLTIAVNFGLWKITQ